MLDIRDNLRDDERRKREEARLNAMQAEIDELRSLLRESASRHGKVEEAQSALSEQLVTVDERITTVQQEARGQSDLREVEITRVRGEFEERTQRLAADLAPIPNLQAQITDLSTHIRARFQELGEDRHRFGELQAQIDQLPPQVERSAEIARAVREELVGIRAEIDTVRNDWRKTGDAIGLVEQDLRRRAGELVTRLDETNGRLEALKEELPPFDLRIERLRTELQAVTPQFAQLASADTDIREELESLTALSFDNHMKSVTKAEEARLANEERLRLVERLNDTRFASTMARFGELESADQALGHRLTLLAVRLDELRDEDEATRLEVRRLTELRLRVQLEQAQHELQVFNQRFAELEGNLSSGEDEDE